MPLVHIIMNSIKRLTMYARNFGLSAVVDLSVFSLVLFFLKPILGGASSILLASVSARVLSSLLNFHLNKVLFASKATTSKSFLLRYYILWSSLIALSSTMVYLLYDIFGINEVLAKAMSDMSLGIFSYLSQVNWVFKEKKNVVNRGLYFRIARRVLRLFVKRKVTIDKEIFTGPNVLVGHHQNFYGPISAILWLPDTVNTWVISHLFNFKECFSMYYHLTFRKTMKLPRVVAFILSTSCALLIPPLLRSGKLIPVHRDSKKIIETFNLSIDLLNKGEQVLVFPDIKYNDKSALIGEVHTGFLHLEKLYFRFNKTHLGFVPITIDKTSSTIANKATIYFSGNRPYEDEKDSVVKELLTSINSKDI